MTKKSESGPNREELRNENSIDYIKYTFNALFDHKSWWNIDIHFKLSIDSDAIKNCYI